MSQQTVDHGEAVFSQTAMLDMLSNMLDDKLKPIRNSMDVLHEAIDQINDKLSSMETMNEDKDSKPRRSVSQKGRRKYHIVDESIVSSPVEEKKCEFGVCKSNNTDSGTYSGSEAADEEANDKVTDIPSDINKKPGSVMIRPKKAAITGKAKCPELHESKELESQRIASTPIAKIFQDFDPLIKFPFEELHDHLKKNSQLETIKESVLNIAKEIVGPQAIYAGSAFENLSVGEPYEFDIQWPVEGKYDITTGPDKKDIQVKDAGSENILTPEKIRNELKQVLEAKLEALKSKLPTGWEYFDKSDLEKCLLTHRKGFQIGLRFKQKSTEEVGILLDLIPCIKLPPSFSEELISKQQLAAVNNLLEKHKCQSAAKDIQDLYLVFSNTSWRVSTSIAEKTISNLLGDVSTVPLRILKYMAGTFIASTNEPVFSSGKSSLELYGSSHLIPSYILKNEYLKLMVDPKLEMQSIACGVSLLINKLEECYPIEAAARTQGRRHFLLALNDVYIMEDCAQQVRQRLGEIKKHFHKSSIQVQQYPMLNFPPVTLPD